jgi:hypothetical protein
MKISIVSLLLLFAVHAQAWKFSGTAASTFLINENSQIHRTTGTCQINALILENDESFKIEASQFQCPEFSWSDVKSLYKKDGVLYDRLGVAVGNHYPSGTMQFPTTTSKDFNYTEKVFDRNCKVVGENSRRLPLIQTVVYAFQPQERGYNLTVEMYWEKAVRMKPASPCAGAEAWGKIEDQGRLKGTLQVL